MKTNRVPLGNVVYFPSPERALFRPSFLTTLCVLLLGGIFTLVPGYMALALVAGALNDMFGWKLLGVTSSGGPQPGTPARFVMEVLAVVFSALPALFAVIMGSGVLSVSRFYLQPAIFDYERGVFRRGEREICRLSDISALLLRRITDPNYPGRAQCGLAVVLKDGAVLSLEWRFAFLRHFGKRAAEPYTDLGMLGSSSRLEAVRKAIAEVAERLGVPLQQFEERGNFNVDKGM